MCCICRGSAGDDSVFFSDDDFYYYDDSIFDDDIHFFDDDYDYNDDFFYYFDDDLDCEDSDTPALAVQAVSKRYGGIQALDNVGLSINPGEIVGLIGANGAGKTTLANIVSGLDRPDHGTLFSRGLDLARTPPTAIARHGVARTFQTPQLPDMLSVRDIGEKCEERGLIWLHCPIPDFDGPGAAFEMAWADGAGERDSSAGARLRGGPAIGGDF